jgi:uncharacterized protein (DUF302 family)
MFDIGYRVESKRPFEEVTSRLEAAIPQNGFRVLAVHDVQKTLEDKGFDSKPLKIIELCNAKFAHEALSREIDVAMLMPCKIVVRSEGTGSVMTMVRPSMISQFFPTAGLDKLAAEVEDVMKRIMDEAG